MVEIVSGKSINLSKTTGRPVRPNIAVSTNNTLYVSWKDNANNARQNQNLHFVKSMDGGNSFSQPVNIAREDVLGIPAIAPSEKTNLYIIWAANFTGNYVIHFSRNTDSGNTFSAPVNLTHRNGQSSSPQIYPSKNSLYIVLTHDSIYFEKSIDGGGTFGDPINLTKIDRDHIYLDSSLIHSVDISL